jgi:histidinol-phosphatase (PHP family)
MVKTASKMGVEYYAVTDHCDMDYRYNPSYSEVKELDINKYIENVTQLKEKYPFLALGIECGYSKNAIKDYMENVPFEKFDYIINSTHSVDNKDCYYPEYFGNMTKYESYKKYLLTIRESLEVPYAYNTISHIGYVRKNAPYENKDLRYLEFRDIIDEILKRMVELGKCLEINTNTKGQGFMPGIEIVKRFSELGGENLSFASDAHVANRICENYDLAKEMATICGFSYWTVFRNQKPIKIKI